MHRLGKFANISMLLLHSVGAALLPTGRSALPRMSATEDRAAAKTSLFSAISSFDEVRSRGTVNIDFGVKGGLSVVKVAPWPCPASAVCASLRACLQSGSVLPGGGMRCHCESSRCPPQSPRRQHGLRQHTHRTAIVDTGGELDAESRAPRNLADGGFYDVSEEVDA